MSSRSNRLGANSRPSKRGRKLQRPARRSAAIGLQNPPQFESNVRSRHKYRFTMTAAASTTFTDSSFNNCLGGVCTVVNTTVTSFVQSFIIKRIDLWAAPAAQGNNATCSVEWFGFGNSPNIEHSDTTLSVARNAHVSSVPPAQSLAAFWQKPTGTNLCIISGGAGTIVDVTLDLMLTDDEQTAVNRQVAVATGVLGTVYYLALDQVLGTHNFVPVSMVTTF